MKALHIYTALLVVHALHVIEESLWDAWFINAWYKGLLNFHIVNWLLFVLAIASFWITFHYPKWYFIGYVYGGIMLLDGIDHVVTFGVTGKYVGGAAGFVTGLLLIIFGLLLIYSLYAEKPKAVIVKQDHS